MAGSGAGPTGPGGPATRDRGRPGAHRSIPVARVIGITIRVHWTFLLLVAVVAAVDWRSGLAAVLWGLLWITVLFACVVVHELSHCVVARRRGATVQGILLLPIGGLSQLDRMPDAPADELAIAIAGPLASLVVGILALAGGLASGGEVWPPTLLAGSWWARIGWLNLLLGAFNLLPALPMDGGRVLRAALARSHSKVEATRLAGRIGRVLAVVMILAGFAFDIWLVLIGLFVLLGSAAEEAAAEHDEAERGPSEPPWPPPPPPGPWPPPPPDPWPEPWPDPGPPPEPGPEPEPEPPWPPMPEPEPTGEPPAPGDDGGHRRPATRRPA